MDESLINKISKNENTVIGLLTLAATSLVATVKLFKALLKAFKLLKAEKTFESYNENIRIVSQKVVTYKFKSLTLKKDSEEIFNSMKHAYLLESETNINGKTINFKMYEIPDDEILLSNVIKFLDFYRVKNGVKVLIFLQTPLDSSKGIKKQLSEYIEKSNIHGAKII